MSAELTQQEQNRKAVIDAASDPSNRSKSAIAKAAGVSRPTVYRLLQDESLQRAIDVKKGETLKALAAVSKGADAGWSFLHNYLRDLIDKGKSENGIDVEDISRVLALTKEMSKAKIDHIQHGLSAEEDEDLTSQEMEEAGDLIGLAYDLGHELEGDVEAREQLIDTFIRTGEVANPLQPVTLEAELIDITDQPIEADPPVAVELTNAEERGGPQSLDRLAA